jgi:DNA-binding NarL/FixJ family response regulator
VTENEQTNPTVNPGVTRVMIVDDHAVVREGLVALLGMRERFQVVAEAGDVTTALRLFREHRPDITIMDLQLPDGSGVEAITRIRTEFPDSRFIVLTTYDGDEDIFRAIKAGAAGYLLKAAGSRDLIQALEAVCEGQRWIPGELAERALTAKLNPGLTRRETEVLQLLAEGKSNAQVASALGLTEPTVKGHINHLYAKLGVNSRTRAVLVGQERGLVKR